MPVEALEMIRHDVEDATPNMLVSKVWRHFKNVSRQQVYNAWAKLSEGLWKHDSDQITSARLLLKEYLDDIDLFEDVIPEPGVQQLCFALKRVLLGLKDKVVEIGMDATCNFFFCLICI